MINEIKGQNIILRKRKKADAPFFVKWFNTTRIMFQCGFTEPTTLEHEEKNPDTENSDWYTITTLDGEIVGETGLLRMWPIWNCTDLTIILPNPDTQGKGYGSEAIELMFDLAFNHYHMNRISIGVVALNPDAIRFYEMHGFIKEGIQEQGYYYNNEYSDFVMMRILKTEWLERRNKSGN